MKESKGQRAGSARKASRQHLLLFQQGLQWETPTVNRALHPGLATPLGLLADFVTHALLLADLAGDLWPQQEFNGAGTVMELSSINT